MATKPSDLEQYRDNDATLNWMLKRGIEPTRENYIDFAYGGTPPSPWTHEHESMLPEPLQDGSKVGQ
jgi:hypothetical protein